MTPDIPIATIPKNSREHFSVSLRTFKGGHRAVDFRVYKSDGVGLVTKFAFGIRPKHLDAFIRAFEAAKVKARAEGLIPVDEEGGAL